MYVAVCQSNMMWFPNPADLVCTSQEEGTFVCEYWIAFAQY